MGASFWIGKRSASLELVCSPVVANWQLGEKDGTAEWEGYWAV